MSDKCFRINAAAIDDAAVQILPPKEFRRAFYAALRGEQNAFSRHIKPDRGRPQSNEWRELRSTVFKRDDYTCVYCGERGGRLECDHVVPVSRGGHDRLDNLATACFACNRSKRDKLLSEWIQ